MTVVTELPQGFKIAYHIRENSTAVYGGDGIVQPAMTLAEAKRLRQSITESLGVPPDRLELVPLGDVQKVETSGPSRPLPYTLAFART